MPQMVLNKISTDARNAIESFCRIDINLHTAERRQIALLDPPTSCQPSFSGQNPPFVNIGMQGQGRKLL